jgi:hypothetical protein
MIPPPLASYREAMTSLVAFQSGSTDAFSLDRSIDDAYLDGLSITVGASPREHVASYAAGISDVITCTDFGCVCPCLGGVLPTWLRPKGPWRCESAALDEKMPPLLLDDPLFDGAEIPLSCAPESKSGSISDASAEPIRTRFDTATSANLEARLMHDELDDVEGLAVYRLELWIR